MKARVKVLPTKDYDDLIRFNNERLLPFEEALYSSTPVAIRLGDKKFQVIITAIGIYEKEVTFRIVD